MSGVQLERPWLEMRFLEPRQVLSWTLNAPGFHTAERILWREVRNADLTPDLDVGAWLDAELAARGAQDVPCFLTSRNIEAFETSHVTVEGVTARCVATVGLSNAERVGRRMAYDPAQWGTINIAVELDLPLAKSAMLEALSMATQARTAAIIDKGHEIKTGIATGTGTDCIAIAASEGDTTFCGLHTAQGEALGQAVYQAVASGTQNWLNSLK